MVDSRKLSWIDGRIGVGDLADMLDGGFLSARAVKGEAKELWSSVVPLFLRTMEIDQPRDARGWTKAVQHLVRIKPDEFLGRDLLLAVFTGGHSREHKQERKQGDMRAQGCVVGARDHSSVSLPAAVARAVASCPGAKYHMRGERASRSPAGSRRDFCVGAGLLRTPSNRSVNVNCFL